jgi:hypothetical protein
LFQSALNLFGPSGWSSVFYLVFMVKALQYSQSTGISSDFSPHDNCFYASLNIHVLHVFTGPDTSDNSTEPRPSWEADSHSPSPEILPFMEYKDSLHCS